MKNKYLFLSVLAIALVTTIVTLPAMQQRQDIRQRAAGNNPSVSIPQSKDTGSYQIPLPPENKAYLAPNDTNAPTVSITNPVNGSKVRTNQTVNISAQSIDDTQVGKVEFLVNGVVYCITTASPHTCSWKVPQQKNARYVLVIRSSDPTGNISSQNVVISSY